MANPRRPPFALFLAAALAAAPAGGAPYLLAIPSDWSFEVVAAPRYFPVLGDRAIASDDYGNEHIAYGGDHLYVTRWTASGWQTETVNSGPGVGAAASIAVSSTGGEHVAYYDAVFQDLMYSKRTCRPACSWLHERADPSSGDVGSWTSIALDASGLPHIAYTDVSNGRLKHAWRDASGVWQREQIVLGGEKPSIAAGTQIHVAFTQDGVLKYAVRGGGGVWLVETADWTGYEGASAGAAPSLALDWAEWPWISSMTTVADGYEVPDNQWGLRVSHKDGSGWHTENAANELIASRTSLVVDASGYPHVATSGAVQYRWKDAGGWHLNAVQSGSDASLALDGETGTPLVVFLGGADGHELRYSGRICLPGCTWWTSTLDRWDVLAGDTHIAVEPAGRAHVTFRANPKWGSAALWYAVRGPGGWASEQVAAAVDDHAIAVDSTGTPHLAFSDAAHALAYAWRDGGGWHVEKVDESVYARSIDIEVSRSGWPHISYHDYIYEHLYHAWKTASGWHTEMVAADGSWRGRTSLAVDGLGWPRILYEAYIGKALRFAWKDASGWHLETVDSCAGCVTFAEGGGLAYAGGAWHAVYRDAPNGDLKHAVRATAGWSPAVVDSTGDVGGWAAATSDALGRLHASYYDASAGNLKYAGRDGSGWTRLTLDSAGVRGTYSSVDVDGWSRPHISYVDESNHDVLYAWAIGVVCDANGDGRVSVADLFRMLDVLLKGGPAAVGSTDCNGDFRSTAADLVYLINHLLAGGPPPVS